MGACLLRRRNQRPAPMSSRPPMPPTTPPTMAPVLDFLVEDVDGVEDAEDSGATPSSALRGVPKGPPRATMDSVVTFGFARAMAVVLSDGLTTTYAALWDIQKGPPNT
ncbi:hypothetical protein TWF696_007750 [Orbilia brochopaga]|uniref:Uncharacterized protein n=1 Tax=Orbilia brochopaga TaxID=3140254 RepID=A0AAV9UQK5_9PEZI